MDIIEYNDSLKRAWPVLMRKHEKLIEDLRKDLNYRPYFKIPEGDVKNLKDPFITGEADRGSLWLGWTFFMAGRTFATHIIQTPTCCGMMTAGGFGSGPVELMTDVLLDFAYQNTYTKVEFTLVPMGHSGNKRVYQYLQKLGGISEQSFKSRRTGNVIHVILADARPFQ